MRLIVPQRWPTLRGFGLGDDGSDDYTTVGDEQPPTCNILPANFDQRGSGHLSRLHGRRHQPRFRQQSDCRANRIHTGNGGEHSDFSLQSNGISLPHTRYEYHCESGRHAYCRSHRYIVNGILVVELRSAVNRARHRGLHIYEHGRQALTHLFFWRALPDRLGASSASYGVRAIDTEPMLRVLKSRTGVIKNGQFRVTDRAHRYRANRNLAARQKHCFACGRPQPRDVHHIDGRENNGNPSNLTRACRSCNVRIANVMRCAGLGTKTRQYNPKRKTDAHSLGAY